MADGLELPIFLLHFQNIGVTGFSFLDGKKELVGQGPMSKERGKDVSCAGLTPQWSPER